MPKRTMPNPLISSPLISSPLISSPTISSTAATSSSTSRTGQLGAEIAASTESNTGHDTGHDTESNTAAVSALAVHSSPLRAMLWMLGALTSFSLMAVAARELSSELNTFQVLLFRSVFGLSLISIIIFAKNKQHQLKTHKLKLHGLRNIFHFIGQYAWFLGLAALPLAEVFALEFTVPIWTIIIAALLLGERITPRKLLAIVLGIAAVLIIVQPGLTLIKPMSLVVLGAAFAYACAHTATKALTPTESPLSIVFYMCLIQLPIAFGFAYQHWIWPNLEQTLWLSVVGLTALTAHYCMSRAMSHTEVGHVVIMDFLRLPLIALVGIALYNESLNISLIIGAGLMLMANVILFVSNKAKR
ncbi:MAG: drug/metabolite transporter (DMT)-like permease [Flavobacteriales bacterium]|jgi:drug/metabolite transporter (DMT)-like permease